ncbi:uncharacterized protein LOC127437324 [Myxocyprinus asiaticus]|uniref:uncharacterized protein LOC127437324 n=1 Tax=Myxocyprinus asiaticus TaxID=70543 RepID=UPI0022225335|nr:uncharacterized protein LOC127437324 [Myxocyprinus asiaticus]
MCGQKDKRSSKLEDNRSPDTQAEMGNQYRYTRQDQLRKRERAQAEDRQVLRSLIPHGASTGVTSAAAPAITHFTLAKLGPEDDPEAFVELFELVMEAAEWPESQWAVRLLPLLSGDVQLAAQQLPVANLLGYQDLKCAILQLVGRRAARPAFAQQLRDSCRRWLLAAECNVVAVVDLVVLKQLINRLPKGMAEWVQCLHPASLDEAIQMAEDNMAAYSGAAQEDQKSLLAEYRGAKWTYNGPYGEHHWSTHYPFCGGAFQSPIDFQTQLLRYDPNLPPIQIQNYNLSTNEQLTLGNNGHSVQLSLPSHMYISSLSHRYSAAQLHFHWGSSNLLTGSEHTVNGKRFAAEMHVVHFNSDKYPSISVAVDKQDGLAVLGVFIEIGESNPALDKFLKYISGIKYRDQKIQVPAFNIRELLPARLDEYYRYDGSLTTPPCYPSVLWTVFRKPVTISRKQFLALATSLYASYAQESAPVLLHGNYRKPQLTDNRVILVSFKDGLHDILSVASPFQRRQVIQKLLVCDLADLADEGLYQLLPKMNHKPGVDIKLKNIKKLWSQATQKQHWPKNKAPSSTAGNNMPASPYMSTLYMNKVLCFESLEKNIIHQLQRCQAMGQMVQALREVVFPELNLKSYLDCRSDLDLEAMRQLVQGRPRDEAAELEQSLAKAMQRQMKRQIKRQRNPNLKSITGHPQAMILKNYNLASSYHRPQLRNQETNYLWISLFRDCVLATVLVAAMLGFLLIITLVCCLLRKRSTSEEQKDTANGYKLAKKEENISTV